MIRKLALLALLMALVLLNPCLAQARFIDGYLAQCAAVAAGSCTEVSSTGYARQPMSFAAPVRGVTVNAVPYTFAPGTGSIVGRAVYDAATGGNLLFVLPLAAALTPPSQGDRGDIGAISMTLTALAGLQTGDAYSGSFAAGSAIGTTPDGSSVTAGVPVVSNRGIFSAVQAVGDPSYSYRNPLTTGFSVTGANGSSTLIINGAGTLATEAVTLPAAPNDGQRFRLLCGVTVTSLTVTANTGQTLLGAPTTCGTSTGHEWLYVGGTAKTWFALN